MLSKTQLIQSKFEFTKFIGTLLESLQEKKEMSKNCIWIEFSTMEILRFIKTKTKKSAQNILYCQPRIGRAGFNNVAGECFFFLKMNVE